MRDNIGMRRRPGQVASKEARAAGRLTGSIEQAVNAAERALEQMDVALRTQGRAAIDAELGPDAPQLIQAWQRLRQFVNAFDPDANVPAQPHAGGPNPDQDARWKAPANRGNPDDLPRGRRPQ